MQSLSNERCSSATGCTISSVQGRHRHSRDCIGAKTTGMSAYTGVHLMGGHPWPSSPVQSSLSYAADVLCRCRLSTLVEGTKRRPDEVMAQGTSLFRGRGSVLKFWMFQRNDLAAQRGSKCSAPGSGSGDELTIRYDSAGPPRRSFGSWRGGSKQALVVAPGRPLTGWAFGMR